MVYTGATFVLVAGMGPSGFALAHFLMNDGHTVVGVDHAGWGPAEAAIRLLLPIYMYPMFESAMAAAATIASVPVTGWASDGISGINHGANHSINVIYSGTMSAAVEAAIESIPSVGFSLLDYSIEADFEPASLR